MSSTPVDVLQWLRVANRSELLTPAERSVAVEIATRINSRSGVCFPGMQTIADSLGLCLSLVKRAVRKLVDMGLLAVRYTGRSNVYSLRGLPGWPSDSHDRRPKRAKMMDEDSPLPPAAGAEPASCEREKAKIDSEAPERPCEPLVVPGDGNVVGEPENGSESVSEASVNDSEALQVVLALIAASGAQYSTKPGSGPVRAAEKALRAGYTVEQIKLVISWCAATWSNPAFLTPSAVLRLSRLDERLAQAQASAPAGQRASCHKPFEREKPVKRTDPASVAGHLSRLRAALVA
jgi:hypothetical protein